MAWETVDGPLKRVKLDLS